jgi:hypothetical protein
VSIQQVDIITRPIHAIDRAEIVIERFKAAIAQGEVEEAERLLARLQMLIHVAGAILAERQARPGVIDGCGRP